MDENGGNRMVAIHFPCMEAGRVRPVCGAARGHVDWTTAPEKVTCPRCRALVSSSEGDERHGPRSTAPADASYGEKAS